MKLKLLWIATKFLGEKFFWSLAKLSWILMKKGINKLAKIIVSKTS